MTKITKSTFINLANRNVGNGLLGTGESNFELAQTYAKQKAIEFAEWLDTHYHGKASNEELYNLYLQSKTTNDK